MCACNLSLKTKLLETLLEDAAVELFEKKQISVYNDLEQGRIMFFCVYIQDTSVEWQYAKIVPLT